MFRQLIAIALFAAPALAGAQQTMPDTTFHPISLAEALRLAHDNNVSNITAANSIRSANYNIRSARAELYPNVSASASQNRSAGDRLGQSGQIVPYTSAWTYNTGLNIQQTLFDGGKSFADVRNQQALLASAQASQVNTEYTVAFNVKQAYNAVLAAKESESAARAQLATAQEQLNFSIAKVNAGAATISDSLQGIVNVGNAQLAVLQAQNNYRTSSASLTRFVGTPYFVTADVNDTTDHSLAPVDSALIMNLALNGPTIKSAQAAVNAAGASIRAAKTAYFPTVSATAGLGGSGTAAMYGLNGNPYPYQRTLGLNFSYPLFNRFGRENTVGTAQIQYDNAVATERDARLAAQQNVITGLANLRNAEQSMRVQETSVRAAQENLRVVQQRYNLGASTILDVLTSQQALANAQQGLIQQRFNYRNARAQLEQAIGQNLP